MTTAWIQRRSLRREVLLMLLVAVCLFLTAHGYSDVVNVGDIALATNTTDPTPEPTTPEPTTPEPTTKTPAPTTPEPTTKTPPPTTPTPPPTTKTPPPTTTPPPTEAPTTAPPTTATTTTAPPAVSTTTPPSTTAPSSTQPPTTKPVATPSPTETGSTAGLTGGGRADDTKTKDSSSGGKYAIVVAVVVVVAVVLIASIYVLRRNRAKKTEISTELRRQLDQLDMELGNSAYAMAKASDDVVRPGGLSGSGSRRGSYSSFPFRKSQQSPASWSSSWTTAVSSNDRESLSGLWKDPDLLAARIPYEKLRFGNLLSRGGFGEVFEGVYHNQRVAIKRLLPENCRRMAALEDFLKEAQLLTLLQHERIVAFIGVAWDSPRDLSIVLEFMPNGDLRNLLSEWRQEGRKTGWADVRKVRIALHIAEALTFLHTLSPKVVHRDLKSKNILLDEQWQAKLSDFGVSRTESTHNTMTTNVGSSLWIAPEVMMGSDYDEKADIYSFGIVLTELDSLQLPYHNAMTPDGRKMPDAAILHLVTMGKLQAEFSSMSRTDMVLLGRSCLAMDPTQRPSAAELRFRLSQILGSY